MFGKIPRFSPSFSPKEALLAFRYLVKDGPNDSIVQKFEKQNVAPVSIKCRT